MMIVDGIDFPAFIRKASPNLHHAHDSGIGKGASATAAPVPADVPLFGQGGLSEAAPHWLKGTTPLTGSRMTAARRYNVESACD